MNLKSFLLLLFFALTSSHCGTRSAPPAAIAADGASRQQVYTAKLDWQTPVAARTPLAAKLSFQTASGAPSQSIANLSFKPWMPSMGHGTSTADQSITVLDGSTALVEGIYLSMGGDWEIRLTATVDGVTDSATIAVSVP